MNTKRPLTPGFINRIDQQLLKNNPVTWSTRIFMAIYYGLAFSILLFLICFIVPDDPRNGSTIYYWIVLLSIISLLAFIFWMIYLLRFNVFKRYGKWESNDTIKTFFLYFLITLLIVSLPFIPPIVQSIRANIAYTSDELARDINDMNIKLCQLERDSLIKRFERDTFQISNTVAGSERREIKYDETIDEPQLNNYYFIDTATLRYKLLDADSINKISDSVYVIYKCPGYQIISNYSIEKYASINVLKPIELYRQFLQNKKSIDKRGIKNELDELLSKYKQRRDENTLTTSYYNYNSIDEQTNFNRIGEKYDLYIVNTNIDNIAEKKYRWDNDTIQGSLRVTYYITLVLSLLVLIYRHTTRRTFFLSLLSAVVLTILTGLFLAMSSNSGVAFYTWIIFYFIIFSLIAATIIKSRHRNVISGIALNLLVFITAFMPLVITATYYTILHNRHEYNNEMDSFNHLFKNEELHYFISEITGFVLLLVLLATLLQLAYRKWYSLPDQ